MINIPVSEEQKRKIEEKYWKWFKKYHIKELKSVIKKDCVMHKVIRAVMEMKEISEELTSIEKEEVQRELNEEEQNESTKRDKKDSKESQKEYPLDKVIKYYLLLDYNKLENLKQHIDKYKYEKKIKERYVDDSVKFYFSGLNSTEGLFSVSLSMDDKKSAIVPESMFYEFLPVDANDDFSQIVTLDKVEIGKDYEIIMTNLNGLYRYRMRDCIRIMDKYNELPLIQFQYRLDQVADIIDDHTEEADFTQTVLDTVSQLGLDLVDYSVYPDRDADLPRYVFFLELADIPDEMTKEQIRSVLHNNLEKYSPDIESYRKKGIGAPTELHILQPETYMLYQDIMILKGRNPAQIKPVHIITNEFHYRFFSKLIEEKWENQHE